MGAGLSNCLTGLAFEPTVARRLGISRLLSLFVWTVERLAAASQAVGRGPEPTGFLAIGVETVDLLCGTLVVVAWDGRSTDSDRLTFPMTPVRLWPVLLSGAIIL